MVGGPAQYGATALTLRCTKGDGKPGVSRCMPGAGFSLWRPGRPRLIGQPSSRTGENPPYGMSGGIEETSASFEARSAPWSYPTTRVCCMRGDKLEGNFMKRIVLASLLATTALISTGSMAQTASPPATTEPTPPQPMAGQPQPASGQPSPQAARGLPANICQELLAFLRQPPPATPTAQ